MGLQRCLLRRNAEPSRVRDGYILGLADTRGHARRLATHRGTCSRESIGTTGSETACKNRFGVAHAGANLTTSFAREGVPKARDRERLRAEIAERAYAPPRCGPRSAQAKEARAAADTDPEQERGSEDDAGARSIDPQEVWARLQRGEARLLDLRTQVERRRYGAAPGAVPVSLARHLVKPEGKGTIYLCQHAVRSKATLRNGAAEVAGGFVAWRRAGLPVEQVK